MITEKAYAKINLALEVVGKREDGYHELKMIMIPIELHDVLLFKDAKKTSLESNIFIKNNSILKTIKYMQDKYSVDKNVEITVEKNIPIGAGLGGGSADISATLRGLNKLWNLGLSLKDLEEDANALGSDTLFCLYNRPAYVYGRGDKIEFLNQPEFREIYLFYPQIEVSTKKIFEAHKIDHNHVNFDELIEYYQLKEYEKFFKNTFNDLYKTAILTYKKLEKYEKTIKKVYKNAYMSGSGSTYFIVNFKEKAEEFNKIMDKIELKHVKTAPKQ